MEWKERLETVLTAPGSRLLVVLPLLCILLLSGCPSQKPDIVGVMYHHWWTPGRWSHNPLNHPYEPVLGHYSNADPAVITQHIEWAQEYGVNTLILNFWITDHDQWWVDPNTRAVADLCDAMGMNYFFLIDGWFEFEDSRDQAFEIAWRVNARAAPYFSRPGYLKSEGKPVVFFWAAYPTDCSLWYSVRSGIEGTSGPIFMTGDKWDCFDLRMLYNPYTAASADYGVQLERQADLWKDRWEKREPWAPTAMPGYDDYCVRPEAGNPIVPLDDDFFRDSIRTALQRPQHHSDGSTWLFVCSWSEWHEGSQIEPADDFADPLVFLKVLKEEVQ
ncbi:glycoside hydrolase family 99-like domain-containing protein [Thermodesulfobacteriota bacterium]